MHERKTTSCLEPALRLYLGVFLASGIQTKIASCTLS